MPNLDRWPGQARASHRKLSVSPYETLYCIPTRIPRQQRQRVLASDDSRVAAPQRRRIFVSQMSRRWSKETKRLFDPSYAVENIRPKPVPAAYKAFPGDMIRMVLSMLRESPGPLSTKQITLHVMAARDVDSSNKQDFELFRQRVGSMLRHHRSKGLIRSFAGEDGSFMLWEIAPQ